MAAYTGDRSKVRQVDPGRFQDTATGDYWTGSWDNATNQGQNPVQNAQNPYSPQRGALPIQKTDGDWRSGPVERDPEVPGQTPPYIPPNDFPPPAPTTKPGLGSPAPTAQYLQSLIASGMSPQEAIAQFNRETGRTTGNEAMYYGPEVHGKETIGLPSEYLSNESNGWAITQRQPEPSFNTRTSNPGINSGASGSMNYDQALAMLQKNLGRPLSQAEISEAFSKFGGNQSSTFTAAGLQPVLDYFKQKGGQGGPGPNDVTTQRRDALYQILMDRAKQGTNVSGDDPNIKAQVTPYAASIERERRNYLADAAERGGPLVNLTGEKRMASERAGQATGAFESQLLGREIQSKRDEIQAALSQMGNQLTADQQAALQRELGYLNDATQRYGIDTNYNLGMGNLGLGWGRLGLDTELGRGNLRLGNNRLGLDYSDLDWRMDPRNPNNLPR